MRKSREFVMFGVFYRVKQFSAVEGMVFLESDADEPYPCDMLAYTEAKVIDGWASLAVATNVDELVRDMAGIQPPRVVLQGLTRLVHEFNFGFLHGWKGVKVPGRYTTGLASINSQHSDPMLAHLVQENIATLRELEEYYSLEDAFSMFDMSVAKGVNAARANEAAMKPK